MGLHCCTLLVAHLWRTNWITVSAVLTAHVFIEFTGAIPASISIIVPEVNKLLQ